MILNSKLIINYTQNFLNSVFNEEISVDILKNIYLINKTLKISTYPFWQKSDQELLKDFKDFTFNGDLIGTIFFFLSGYWEYTHQDIKDKYNRFSALESFQYRKDVLEQPVVDILVDRIREELNLTYKDNKPKIYLTHDIDLLALLRGKLFIRTILGDLLRRKSIGLLLERIKMKFRGKDPFSVHNLIKIHKKNNTKGTFFFLTEKQENTFSGGYSAIKNQKELKEIGEAINQIAGTIGIHYDSRYLIEERLEKDREVLEDVFKQEIKVGRAHYLLFDITKTFDILEKAGIRIDSTGGYADRIGFRFGTSRLFKPYNFKTGKEYNLWETPLIVMDGTLVDERYMSLTHKDGLKKIREIMDKVSKYNGVFTILWHNTSFYTDKWRDWEGVYEGVLGYSKELNMEMFDIKELQEST
jgi:hypothetical protein